MSEKPAASFDGTSDAAGDRLPGKGRVYILVTAAVKQGGGRKEQHE
jgi:hypothetical protein